MFFDTEVHRVKKSQRFTEFFFTLRNSVQDSVNLCVKKNKIITFLFLLSFLQIQAQDCPTPAAFQAVQRNGAIEWEKFPDFSLPFTIIYEGPRLGDTQSMPLKKGFSHLATFSGNEAATLPASKRAVTWYGVATGPAPLQPWSDKTIESPWGNDLALFRQSWSQQLGNLAFGFNDTKGKAPNYDILALDVERILDTDREILGIKTNPKIPKNISQFLDNQFIERYKRDIQKLYIAPIDYAKTQGLPNTVKLSSYGDVLVRGSINNWLALKVTSWKDWTTNTTPLLHLMKDTLTTKVGGGFYEKLSILTPSCYYYYGYDNALGKDFLAYLLFVIEANRHWSDKPIIPYVWLRYHDYTNPTTPFVPKFVAEATAIFPFFSGANGLWLWENPTTNSQQTNWATYEYFVGGLYRLSLFKNFFEGQHELVIPQPAIESANTNSPIWRGIVKNNEILIAAQNPYANSDTETKSITISYKNWQKSIILTGREVFLCKFDLTTINGLPPNNIQNFEVYPNPITNLLMYKFQTKGSSETELQITDLTSKIIISKRLLATNNQFEGRISLDNLASGLYIIKLKTNDSETSRKVLVIR